MAPEILGTTAESVPKSKRADIYATGMVIYEVTSSCIPLPSSHPSGVGDISRPPLSWNARSTGDQENTRW
jgi:hypothetical protein